MAVKGEREGVARGEFTSGRSPIPKTPPVRGLPNMPPLARDLAAALAVAGLFVATAHLPAIAVPVALVVVPAPVAAARLLPHPGPAAEGAYTPLGLAMLAALFCLAIRGSALLEAPRRRREEAARAHAAMDIAVRRATGRLEEARRRRREAEARLAEAERKAVLAAGQARTAARPGRAAPPPTRPSTPCCGARAESSSPAGRPIGREGRRASGLDDAPSVVLQAARPTPEVSVPPCRPSPAAA